MSLMATFASPGRIPPKSFDINLQNDEWLVHQQQSSGALPSQMNDGYNRLMNGNATWEELGKVLNLNFADRTLLKHRIKHLMKAKLLNGTSAKDESGVQALQEIFDTLETTALKRSQAKPQNYSLQGHDQAKEDEKYIQAAAMAFCLKVQAEMKESIGSECQGAKQRGGRPTCEFEISCTNDQQLKDCLEKLEHLAERHGLAISQPDVVNPSSSQSQRSVFRNCGGQNGVPSQQHTPPPTQERERQSDHARFPESSLDTSPSIKRRPVRNLCIEDPLYHVEVIAGSVREGIRNRSQLSDMRSELEAEHAQVVSLQERNADLLTLKRQHECRIQELLHHNAIFACELANWKGIKMGEEADLRDKLPSRDILGIHVEKLLENPAFQGRWKRAQKRNMDDELGGRHKAIKVEDVENNDDNKESSENTGEE